jgi:hypothetical protein
MRTTTFVLVASLLFACKAKVETIVDTCDVSCKATACTELDPAAYSGGTATCDQGTCELDLSACEAKGGCDITGFVAAETYAFSDVAVVSIQGLEAYNDGDLAIYVENWFRYDGATEPGTSDAFDLDIGETNLDDYYTVCSTCVVASDGNEEFFPEFGDATVNSPAEAGGDFSIAFSDLRLVSDSGTVWCISALTLSAATEPFTCDYFAGTPVADAEYCLGDESQLLHCTDVGGTLTITASNECSACDESTPGEGVCTP